MNKPVTGSVSKAVDSVQEQLTSYAYGLNYNSLPPEVIHDAKVRIIDTLGSLMGGFFGEPCRIARNLAAAMPNPDGATVIGTRMKTTPDMAAFANATTARFAELTDSYHGSPGGGHISDTITPVLAAAEQTTSAATTTTGGTTTTSTGSTTTGTTGTTTTGATTTDAMTTGATATADTTTVTRFHAATPHASSGLSSSM